MEIIWIFICLCFIAIFSSLIVAYTYSNKIYINLESKKDKITSFTLKILSQNPRLYISTLKTGNTIAIVLFSFLLLNFCKKNFANSIHLAQTWILIIITTTALIYFFSNFIPQTFVKPIANHILKKSNLTVKISIKLLGPLTKPLLILSDFCLRKIFKLSQDKENQLLSISELGTYINKQIETVEQNDKLDTELLILKNALAFTDVLVKKVMVSKFEIEAINIEDSVDTIIEKFIETGYSRLLVYQNNELNIIGYVHIFEILERPISTKSIVYPIEEVNENSLIKDLFKSLSIKRKSIAKVINNENKLVGIITMEDIIEELLGEIDDEHDEKIAIVEKQLTPNRFILSTRFDINYINNKFDLKLSESNEYQTLAAYIYHHTKKIPKKGSAIIIEENTFKILSSSDKKVELVEIITN